MRVLVLGVSGMIGNTVFRVFCQKAEWTVMGAVRKAEIKKFFPPECAERILLCGDLNRMENQLSLFQQSRPDVIINCAGLTKHLPSASHVLEAIPINTLLPHQLAGLCHISGARLIHVSTDCIFSGCKGSYSESDIPDAQDVYGRSKQLGEVLNSPCAITLRTSTIGHELGTSYGLLEWFLAQQGSCRGFRKALFSGLPSVTFARVIRDFVIPRPDMNGLYHVAGSTIAKYDLLKLVAEIYGKSIEIVPEEDFRIDRSLNAERFNKTTGFVPPDWPELIREMHSFR